MLLSASSFSGFRRTLGRLAPAGCRQSARDSRRAAKRKRKSPRSKRQLESTQAALEQSQTRTPGQKSTRYARGRTRKSRRDRGRSTPPRGKPSCRDGGPLLERGIAARGPDHRAATRNRSRTYCPHARSGHHRVPADRRGRLALLAGHRNDYLAVRFAAQPLRRRHGISPGTRYRGPQRNDHQRGRGRHRHFRPGGTAATATTSSRSWRRALHGIRALLADLRGGGTSRHSGAKPSAQSVPPAPRPGPTCTSRSASTANPSIPPRVCTKPTATPKPDVGI